MMGDIVLEERLRDEFFKFYWRYDYDTDILSNLFKFFKPFLLTSQQAEKYVQDRESEEILSILLTKNDNPMWEWYEPKKDIYSDTAMLQEEMVLESNLKILLVCKKNVYTTYPFRVVDISDDKMQLSYNQTFEAKNKRDNAQIHIASFLKKANNIKIYDKFFEKQEAEYFCNFLCDKHIPKNLSIEVYADKQYIKDNKLAIVGIFTRQPNVFNNIDVKEYNDCRHDRYLEIDGKINIILTSGFEHFFSTTKDFTYIVTNK